MDNARVIVNNIVYLLRAKNEWLGCPCASMQTMWNLYTMPDNRTIGMLIYLGKGFGYRLVLRGYRGEQVVSEYTDDKVTFL